MPDLNPDEAFAASFLEAAPYLVQARGAHYVLWLDAEISAAAMPEIAEELATLQALGVRLTLVIDGEPDDHAPLDAAAQAAASARADALTRRWTDLLSRGWVGVPDRRYRLSVLSGNFVTGRRVGVVGGVDHGHLGRVRSVDAEDLQALHAQGHLLVASGAVPGATGLPLWVPPLAVAVELAAEARAAKLVLVSPRQFADELPTEWSPAELTAHLETVPPRERRIGESALAAVGRGVERVHLVGGGRGSLIRELFSRSGSGVLVARTPSSAITTVGSAELGELVALISRFEPDGALAPRSRELIEANLDGFRVLKVDGRIAACGALRRSPEHPQAVLIESIAVHPAMQREGLGRAMVHALERESRVGGAEQAWILTTVAEEWFAGLGYVRRSPDEAPEWLQAAARPGRNSLLLSRTISLPERNPA